MVNTTTNFSFNKPEVNSATDEDLWGGYLNTNWDTADSLFLTRTTYYDFAGYELRDPLLRDYAEKAVSVSSSSNVLTLDMTTANHFYTTLTENVTTLTINNVAASGGAMPLVLYITQDGTGSRTFTFPSSFKWAGGSAVTVTSTAGATDIFVAFTRDGGTTWYANAYGQGFA
ncbi:MAG: hypothetical protein VW683_06765 [Betaproteobacteria bacterium]